MRAGIGNRNRWQLGQTLDMSCAREAFVLAFDFGSFLEGDDAAGAAHLRRGMVEPVSIMRRLPIRTTCTALATSTVWLCCTSC